MTFWKGVVGWSLGTAGICQHWKSFFFGVLEFWVTGSWDNWGFFKS